MTQSTYLAGTNQHEVVVAIFLNAPYRVIVITELFRGTIAQTSVHQCEVVREALSVNGAAAVFAHIHRRGVVEPLRAYELLTSTLRDALQLVDVRVLDHFIAAGADTTSLAERGLM